MLVLTAVTATIVLCVIANNLGIIANELRVLNKTLE